MKKLLKKLVVESWKTTLAGIILAIVTGLVTAGKLTASQGTEIMGFATAIGFTFSKDADKSGFKAVQTSELTVAMDALKVAQGTGNEKLIEVAQSVVDALQKAV